MTVFCDSVVVFFFLTIEARLAKRLIQNPYVAGVLEFLFERIFRLCLCRYRFFAHLPPTLQLQRLFTGKQTSPPCKHAIDMPTHRTHFSLTNPQMDTEERPFIIYFKKFRQRPVKSYKKCRLGKVIMQSVLAATAGMLFLLNISSSLRKSFLAHTESELNSKNRTKTPS